MVRTDEKLWEIVMGIYREAYRKAEPSADLDKLMKEGKTKKDSWYLNYYLPDTEYAKIIESHCKKNKVSPAEKKKISTDLYLGAGPSGVKKSEMKKPKAKKSEAKKG